MRRQPSAISRQRFAVGCVLMVESGLLIAGCGYSTRSLLPSSYRAIYVEPFANRLATTAETSELQPFVAAIPLLEEDVTKAVINRFIFDGQLRVTPHREDASLVLTGELRDFHRQPIQQHEDGTAEAYRLNLIADLVLRERASGVVVWEEHGFVGDTTYFVTGSLAISEATALDNLRTDFARRVVERTIEDW